MRCQMCRENQESVEVMNYNFSPLPLPLPPSFSFSFSFDFSCFYFFSFFGNLFKGEEKLEHLLNPNLREIQLSTHHLSSLVLEIISCKKAWQSRIRQNVTPLKFELHYVIGCNGSQQTEKSSKTPTNFSSHISCNCNVAICKLPSSPFLFNQRVKFKPYRPSKD